MLWYQVFLILFFWREFSDVFFRTSLFGRLFFLTIFFVSFFGCFGLTDIGNLDTFQSRKYLNRSSGINPITFIFSDNSNYGRENFLEVWRQNIAVSCQQTFELLPQVNFPANDLNYHWKEKVMGLNPGYLLQSFLLYLWYVWIN